jgi:hypothetical protein
MKNIFKILITLFLIISTVSALIPITATDKGDTYIKWEWNQNDIINISVDGFNVCNFDNQSSVFILTGLYQNETHNLKIYNNSDYGEISATTTKSSESSLIDTLLYYKWFLLALTLLIIGLSIDSPIVGIFGCAIMGISFVMYLVIDVLSIEVLIYALGLMFSVVIGLARWR